MTIKYTDAETSVDCPIKDKPHPMWLGNQVVAFDVVTDDEESTTSSIAYKKTTSSTFPAAAFFAEDDIVVGHNIKFDMAYYFRQSPYEKLPTLWDTAIAEYILTGQESKFPSLNSLIEKYIGKEALKDDRLKKYWDSGYRTEDIPISILYPYLANDINVLKPIFKAQYELAKTQDQLPLILAMNESLRATTSMFMHGMVVDRVYLEAGLKYYNAEADRMLTRLTSLGINPASPKNLSLYFFGGEEQVEERVSAGFFKNGKPKTKLIKKTITHTAKFEPPAGTEIGKNGYYSVDEDMLNWLATEGSGIAISIMDYRQNKKIATTYYEGILDCVFPNGRVHPSIHHTSTGTGRLSSSHPNLQNQTDKGGIKRAFISRYGNDGFILELDYGQLEVVWLAYLSGDKQLIKDINDGVDLHTVLYTEMYGRAPSKEERKNFKPRTFQLIYGASAKAIAEQGSIPISEAKLFIDVFYKRYPGVKQWHDTLIENAYALGKVVYDPDIAGPMIRYEQQMPTGRKFVHYAKPTDWSKTPTFNPPTLKNYPVQGCATGDMVPAILGILFRALENTDAWKLQRVALIMTVHDSIVLDVHKDELYNVASLCKKVMEDAPNYMKAIFDITFPCKLSVGIEAGKNWQDKVDIKGEVQ